MGGPSGQVRFLRNEAKVLAKVWQKPLAQGEEKAFFAKRIGSRGRFYATKPNGLRRDP
jgi:hypothetical protein